MSDPVVPQHLLDLLEQARGPADPFGDVTEPEIGIGQLWRARWDEDRLLVLILSVEGRDVIAAPVTLDPPAEDDLCLVVDGARTSAGVPATLWAGLTGPVPIRVLDRPVDTWGQDIVHWAATAVPVPAEEVPEGTRRGRPVASALEPAADLRAELDDTLERLRLAPALPVVKPGETPVTLDLAAVVAEETEPAAEGVSPATHPLPPELVAEVEHPRWRPTWTELARRDGVDEATARLTASYGTFAAVDRQAGGEQIDWRERLRQFLDRGGEAGVDR